MMKGYCWVTTRILLCPEDNGLCAPQETRGEGRREGVWPGHPLKETQGAATLRPAVPEKGSRPGGQSYHVAAGLKPQVVSLLQGEKKEQNPPFKKI